MFGSGLIKGLSITLKELFTKKVTVQYPDEIYPLPERFHGRFKLDVNSCISCGLCVRSCPNKAIMLESETVAKKRRLLKYQIDLKYCMFCGFCVEVCPKKALGYIKDFELCQYKWEKIPLLLANEEPTPQEERERLEAEAKKAEEAKKAAAEAAKAEKETAVSTAPGKED
ncbi:NuoI/complex I 23 kDa subunit family protein [Desulfofalx alkaliphila]|uniref:NuoI/complex I 23 kDa subunit family protein n=1 Tax=Desulfofalx alkaliphila TaxID=105483 RepID=UPI0004E25003|nr:NADH-quinone oxidoreductase subunit I [Desulfofalx alkaliphila]